MCGGKPPSPPPPPPPEPVVTAPPPPPPQTAQGAPRPAGYSDERGRDRNTATQAQRKRTGASVLRIPIVGGL